MNPLVSTIICSHNPRPDYLRRVLAALQEQSLPREQWELLLIDNASEKCLADTWDLSWHQSGRHIREDRPGLTQARLRGLREARGELLVFVDDDNIIAPDYLEQALNIPASHPHLGVFGSGTLTPEFEMQPPSELIPRLSLLAIRSVRHVLWSNNIADFACLPWGAGLCVTSRVATLYQDLVARLNVNMILDRHGEQLFCGGDDIFSWACVGGGQGFGLFPDLRVTHLISAARLTRRYYLRLIHDHALSHAVLSWALNRKRPEHVGVTKYVHLLLHGIRNGWFSMQCHWASSRGQEQAARLIADQHLLPIDLKLSDSTTHTLVPQKSTCDLNQ